MCGGATLTRSGHFLSMKFIEKKLCLIYKLLGWIDEGMHIGGAHGHDGVVKEQLGELFGLSEL
jgi:hypothetical protein